MTKLSWPELNAPRRRVLDALVDLCSTSPSRALRALGLTAKQTSLVDMNARLRTASTAAAMAVYSGVLYDALNFPALSAAARKRGQTRVAIASALWGLVRPGDRIPAYRFSADSRIPGLPTLQQIWGEPVGTAIGAEKGLIIDLRSGAYEKLAQVPTSCAQRAVSLRILQDRNGKLSVVSHHNKATKGRLTAALLSEATEPRSVDHLCVLLREHGYRALEGRASRTGVRTLDVIVQEL